MDHFLDRFPEVSDDAPGAGFKKGLMTAMITLGAFIGAINQGWIADWISRKRSLMVAVVVFTIGSTLQTAAINYAMLVVGRFIGGIGIGQSVLLFLAITFFGDAHHYFSQTFNGGASIHLRDFSSGNSWISACI